MAGLSRKLPAGSPVPETRLYDAGQVGAPHPSTGNAWIAPSTGTNTSPPPPTLGGAVIGPPTGADHSSAPVASSNAPSPGPVCVSTTSKRRPPATAGPMLDAEPPAGAVHNGLHAWPPKNGPQFVLPVAANADT